VAHPVNELLEVVHQRVRLGLMAILDEANKAEFTYVRDVLEVTDGNLARHLQVLEDAGLVRLDKRASGNRARTWITITAAGRRAYEAEIEVLREIVEGTRSG
jgi:DNA-binding MarR family transcriptional regulator